MTARSTAALLGVTFLLASCGAVSPAPSATPSSAPERTVPKAVTDAKAVSAKELLEEARAEALKLAPDVVLVSVQNTRWPDFEAHLPPDGKVPEWLYSFTSASKKMEYHIAASTLKVEKRFEGEIARKYEPLPEFWIDSTEAFTATLDRGGKKFIDENPTYPVYFVLDYSQEAGDKVVWDVRYSVLVRDGLFGFRVSPTSPQVLQVYGTGRFAETANPPAA